MAAVQSFIVTVCAMVTASAAVYVANVVRQVRQQINANEERSEQNRRLLLADDVDHFEGVLTRIERLETEAGIDE